MDIVSIITTGALSAVIILITVGVVYLIHQRLTQFFAEKPDQQFQRQMITVGLVLFAALVIILSVPVNDTTRSSLLGLYGIVVSATIALSSTTVVGNIMAGIMLRTIGAFRLGDYIKVGDFFGRVSEMDLLHTEIQTEERDLTTLPNIFLVTHPVRVMRESGSILSVELSLGYEVSRHTIERLLLEAGNRCGLESPFVQIKHLGDYSVTYAIAGLLTDVKSILGKRRQLRAATMDVLHDAGIEIVSPVVASMRNFSADRTFIAPAEPIATEAMTGNGPDSIVFDKALQAEGLDKLRERQTELQQALKTIDATTAGGDSEQSEAAVAQQKAGIERKLERLDKIISQREQEISQQ